MVHMTRKYEPSVDVIIPVYNTELYIIEALESIERQTYPINKVFVINDASTDRSRDKILNYKEKSPLNIEYIELKENKGPAHARNIGIKLSNADYLSFHDADDVITPDKISLQVAYMAEHHDVLFTHTNFVFMDGEGKHIETEHYNRRRGVPVEGDVRELIYYNIFFMSSPTVVIARSAFDRVGLFDENMRYGEDMDIWMKISKISDFGYIPKVCLYMRRHASNTTNSQKMFEGLFPFYNRWLMEFPNDTYVVKSIRTAMPYLAFKSKSRRKFIEQNLREDIQRKLFPFGLTFAILTGFPRWTLKFFKKMYWKTFRNKTLSK
jgi:glycosyltransferase involved in cell wall biosynthesis